jgi:hypothetical protein
MANGWMWSMGRSVNDAQAIRGDPREAAASAVKEVPIPIHAAQRIAVQLRPPRVSPSIKPAADARQPPTGGRRPCDAAQQPKQGRPSAATACWAAGCWRRLLAYCTWERRTSSTVEVTRCPVRIA